MNKFNKILLFVSQIRNQKVVSLYICICLLQNLYEGSNGYKLLEDQAKQYYLSNVDEYLSSPSISQRIKNILDSVTEQELVQLKSDVSDLEPADDETWLDVSPSDLDRILEQKFGLKNSEQSSASNFASSFTDKIRSFLNQASDINGADFSKNHLRQVQIMIKWNIHYCPFELPFQQLYCGPRENTHGGQLKLFYACSSPPYYQQKRYLPVLYGGENYCRVQSFGFASHMRLLVARSIVVHILYTCIFDIQYRDLQHIIV